MCKFILLFILACGGFAFGADPFHDGIATDTIDSIGTEVVFNEDGLSTRDVRIESASEVNCFFLDSSGNDICFGGASAGASAIWLDASLGLMVVNELSNVAGSLRVETDDNTAGFYTNSAFDSILFGGWATSTSDIWFKVDDGVADDAGTAAFNEQGDPGGTFKIEADTADPVFEVDYTGNGAVHLGKATPATSATDGFPWMPAGAGTPTGTPSPSPAGFVPFYWDTTNKTFYVFDAAWINIGGLFSGSVATKTLDVNGAIQLELSDFRGSNAFINVDTYGVASADDLWTITYGTGVPGSFVLYIRQVNSGRDVTVKVRDTGTVDSSNLLLDADFNINNGANSICLSRMSGVTNMVLVSKSENP